MSLAVRFDRYGASDVLGVVEVEDHSPAAGEVRVRVIAAGINPGEIAIREGHMHDRYPATFPSGQGSDFAGIVADVGDKVDSIRVGDEVIGFSDWRSAQAEFVTLPADHVIPKPHGVDWNQAGALYVSGTTARACIATVRLKRGDTVVVGGAGGGVGILTTQLAVLAGALVVATSSKANHAFLERVGAIPVEYGKGLADRIRKIAPDGIDAYIDCFGDGNVEAAVALGVDRDRINTIGDRVAGKKYGVRMDGMSIVPARETMIELAHLMAAGDLTIPIVATYPLTDVRAAYERLARRHGLGKIVLEVSPAP